MQKKRCLSGCFVLLLFVFSSTWAGTGAALQTSSQVVIGSEGWLFLKQELRFLNIGPFWGEDAATASQARRDDVKDPTPAILSFHKALAEKGVTLLLVPVPPKALLYSEYVPAVEKGDSWGESLDNYYKLLREQGVQVVDLRKDLLHAKGSQEKPLYLLEDTHWSGVGVTVAADLLAEQIQKYLPKGDKKYTSKWTDLAIVGDLRKMLGGAEEKEEQVSVRTVSGADGRPPQDDPSSPVLVLGDSHVLVFHDGGDMYTRGAGISDQLALNLGMDMAVIGVRGSGATPARVNLYRKAQRNPDYWKEKKVVVWCFMAREFTESDGWRVLPIEPK